MFFKVLTRNAALSVQRRSISFSPFQSNNQEKSLGQPNGNTTAENGEKPVENVDKATATPDLAQQLKAKDEEITSIKVGIFLFGLMK